MQSVIATLGFRLPCLPCVPEWRAKCLSGPRVGVAESGDHLVTLRMLLFRPCHALRALHCRSVHTAKVAHVTLIKVLAAQWCVCWRWVAVFCGAIQRVGASGSGAFAVIFLSLSFQDVPKVGVKGEHIKVAKGFARNFLVPQGLGELSAGAGRLGSVAASANAQVADELADRIAVRRTLTQARLVMKRHYPDAALPDAPIAPITRTFEARRGACSLYSLSRRVTRLVLLRWL